MGSALSTYACCTTSRKHGAISLSEKTQYTALNNDDDKMAANRILTILQTSSSRFEVQSKLHALKKDGMLANNWTESLAVYVLNGVTVMVQKGADMSEVIKKAHDDVKRDYDAWKAENPEFARIMEIGAEIILTVVVLGILAALMPWALDALGFGTLGPRLGSWAARWQSKYLGKTPARSLFSFLESVGMKYGRKDVVLAVL